MISVFDLNNFGGFILAQTSQQAAPPQQNPMSLIMLVAVVGFAFYFLIIRPQKKEQQKHQQEVNALSKGDKVITIGGIHGTIDEVKNDDTVVLLVDKNTRLTMTRGAIRSVTKKKGEPEQSDKKE